MDRIEIEPIDRPINATVRPPGSKSITNRALVCAALAEGSSVLHEALDSEDTRVMIESLGRLGIDVGVHDQGRTLKITGCGGKLPVEDGELFVANSGTTMRFLTAVAALGRGKLRLDGVERMRERPIGDLADALSGLGGQVECLGANRCPPVLVQGRGLCGGRASIRGDISSQFLSGVLMAAPYAEERVELEIVGRLVSVPYVEMTLRVMEAFGATTSVGSDYRRIEVASQARYRGREYQIEPDASAASYFFAAAAITGGRVAVEGLSRNSLQGDVAFCECLRLMGAEVIYEADRTVVQGRALGGIDVDMNSISDTVQTLAVTALFADGPTRIRNVAHIRHKETDRIAATACELRKLGAAVEEFDDGLAITPGNLRGADIATYNDHRMAMSFALAGLRVPNVVIHDPGCTAKTYPEFFADLARVAGQPRG